MPKSEEIFSIECVVLKHTQKAVLIDVFGEKIWIPKSEMHDVEDLPEKGDANVKMAAWIAKEKGLR